MPGLHREHKCHQRLPSALSSALIGLSVAALAAADRVPISLVRAPVDPLPPPPSRKELRTLLENKLYTEGREFVKWLGANVKNKSALAAPPFNKLNLAWRSNKGSPNNGAAKSLAASPSSSSVGGKNEHQDETSRAQAAEHHEEEKGKPAKKATTTASPDAALQLEDDMRPEKRRERFKNFKHKYALVTVCVLCIPVLIPVLWTASRSTLEACGSARRLPNEQPVGVGAEWVMASVCAMCADNWPGFAIHLLFSCWWLLWFALFCAHGPSA